MQKSLLTLTGFLLFIIGFLAVCLSLIGGQLTYLKWLKDLLGPVTTMIIYFCMIVVGLVLVILAKTNYGKNN